MSRSLYENHWGSPTLTLLNVIGVLDVLYVLNVLNVLYVLSVLHVLNVLHGRTVGLLGLVFKFSPSSRINEEFQGFLDRISNIKQD